MQPDNLNSYLADARSWDADTMARTIRSERRAWLTAGGAGLIAILAVGAVIGLTPLKSVEPYVIRVDNATGIVDVATALKDGKTGYDEAVSKYFLGQYVRLRESYAPDLLPYAYNAVGLLSAPPIRKLWGEINEASNPDNPQQRYGKYGRAETKIRAIQFLGPSVAAVRFSRTEKSGADVLTRTTHWIATVTFAYANEPLAEQDRLINPLGFQVTDYRLDAEVQ